MWILIALYVILCAVNFYPAYLCWFSDTRVFLNTLYPKFLTWIWLVLVLFIPAPVSFVLVVIAEEWWEFKNRDKW
jgi:hypothetical protein